MERRFLIVETSCRTAKVAFSQGERVVAERQLVETRRHARELAPTVRQLLQDLGWQAKDVNAVIVSTGPGSYTGLRVGIMSAKAFAYATEVPLVAVPTFHAIARQVGEDVRELAVIADAQQGRVYTQQFARNSADEVCTPRSELAIVPLAEFRDGLRASTWVSGPGTQTFESQLKGSCLVDEASRLPACESLLRIAWERRDAFGSDALWTTEPIYLRPSAAEEQWAKNC